MAGPLSESRPANQRKMGVFHTTSSTPTGLRYRASCLTFDELRRGFISLSLPATIQSLDASSLQSVGHSAERRTQPRSPTMAASPSSSYIFNAPSSSSDDVDSLPSSDCSSDVGESDAEREWNESLQQLELLLTMVMVPYLGKYFGRKCAYWSKSGSPISTCRQWSVEKCGHTCGSVRLHVGRSSRGHLITWVTGRAGLMTVIEHTLTIVQRLGQVHGMDVSGRGTHHQPRCLQGCRRHRGRCDAVELHLRLGPCMHLMNPTGYGGGDVQCTRCTCAVSCQGEERGNAKGGPETG